MFAVSHLFLPRAIYFCREPFFAVRRWRWETFYAASPFFSEPSLSKKILGYVAECGCVNSVILDSGYKALREQFFLVWTWIRPELRDTGLSPADSVLVLSYLLITFSGRLCWWDGNPNRLGRTLGQWTSGWSTDAGTRPILNGFKNFLNSAWTAGCLGQLLRQRDNVKNPKCRDVLLLISNILALLIAANR